MKPCGAVNPGAGVGVPSAAMTPDNRMSASAGLDKEGQVTPVASPAPGSGLRPGYRSLCSQSTIPFGVVDDADLDSALVDKYSQSFPQCLFGDLKATDVDMVDLDTLVRPAAAWLDFHFEKGDAASLHPELSDAMQTLIQLKEKSDMLEGALVKQEAEHKSLLIKIDFAAKAMLGQQLARLKEAGSTKPEDSPLFKANQQNIEVWKQQKMEVNDKALQLAKDAMLTANDNIVDHIRAMIEIGHAMWLDQSKDETSADLFKELDSIVEKTAPSADDALMQDLEQRLQVGHW